jgi:hypothetical protein
MNGSLVVTPKLMDSFRDGETSSYRPSSVGVPHDEIGEGTVDLFVR